MKVGIIGLPQTGKKTLFQILTGNEITLSNEILLDYTANGKVDMGDALFVLEYLAGLRGF